MIRSSNKHIRNIFKHLHSHIFNWNLTIYKMTTFSYLCMLKIGRTAQSERKRNDTRKNGKHLPHIHFKFLYFLPSSSSSSCMCVGMIPIMCLYAKRMPSALCILKYTHCTECVHTQIYLYTVNKNGFVCVRVYFC